MKNKLIYLLPSLVILFALLFSCRNDFVVEEGHTEHKHESVGKFVSFKKFTEITKISRNKFFQQATSAYSKDASFTDYDIDTAQIRQTMKNSNITAFSFNIYPKTFSISDGNKVFYNLAYIKSGNEWDRYVVKYTSNDANFLMNLQNNPELGFQGSTEVLASENVTSRMTLCAYTTNQLVLNCPYGHTSISDCGGSAYCCQYCYDVIKVTTISNCNNANGSSGSTAPGDNPGGGGGDGGGSEFETNLPLANQNNNTPCAKIKKSTNDIMYKAKITDLEGITGQNHENGYRLSSPVISAGQTGTQSQLLQNRPNTTELEYTFFSSTFAFMHTHYDKMYPIFSPGDILRFNEWIVWANAWNAIPTNTPKIQLNNLTFTVVTSRGNYLLAFDGSTVNALPTYTNQQAKTLIRNYHKKLDNAITVGNVSGDTNYDMAVLEQEFLSFISENMNMTGLKLYRVKSDGNYEISLTNLQGTKCP